MYNPVPITQTATEGVRNYHERRFQQLRNLRTPWEDLWRDIDTYIVPGYLRLEPQQNHGERGRRRRLNIVDNTGQKAHRVFRSGMHSGMTSKARPWNKLTTNNEELREIPDVKMYLHKSTMRLREVMAKSNLYGAFHTKYGSHGSIGTAASYLSPDPKYVVRNTTLIAGTYWIANNFRNEADTLYHSISMTAKQIVEMFDKPGDNVPRVVMEAYDGSNKDMMFLVHHAMEPRAMRDTSSKRPDNMPYLSNYWMDVDDDKDRMLRESGSKINRVIASRWDTVDSDEYGYSLGMDALGDVKQLQKQQARKLEVLDKLTRPPLVGPTSMRGQRTSLLPGAMNFSDEVSRSGGLRPVVDLSSYNLAPLAEDIMNTKIDIKETYFNDLFKAISNMPGIQPRNAMELAERKEESLLQLGPALERLEGEELTPTIAGTIHYMREAGLMPQIPEELKDKPAEMTVQYTSILAQAQRAVGVLANERTVAFIGNLAEAKPEALDKLDVDQAIDDYADRMGASAGIIISDAKVKEMRDARAKQQQQQQAAEQAAMVAPAMKQGAEAARLMSEADDTPGDPTTLLNELNL